MELRSFLKKRSDARTPGLVTAAVVVGFFLLLGGVQKPDLTAVVSLVMIVANGLALAALGNTRRWAVLAHCVFTTCGAVATTVLLYHGASVRPGVVALGPGIRALPLLPSLTYWRRMDW
jgi:hypothetical protein